MSGARWRRSPPVGRRSAADGQAGTARQLGRDDARARLGGARGGARPRVPLRHAGPRRARTCADARDLEVSVIGNDHAQLELYGPGEVVSGHEFYDYAAKYTPGLSETSTHAEVSDVERAVIHKLARDVYRAHRRRGLRPDRLPDGRRADRSSRRSTRSRASRRSASSRRCRPRAATRSPMSACASSSSPSSAMPQRPATHLATGRPAAMTLRPAPAGAPPRARRRPTARRALGTAPVRRTRSIRRASAGLTPVRAGAILAMLLSPRRRCTASPTRRSSRTSTRRSRARPSPTRPRSSRLLEDARGANLFSLVTRPFEDRIRELPTVRSVDVSVRLPDTIGGRVCASGRRSSSGGSGRGATSSMARVGCSRGCPRSRPPSAAALPVVEDRRAASVGLAVGRSLDRVDLDAATRLGVAASRPTWAAPPSGWPCS